MKIKCDECRWGSELPSCIHELRGLIQKKLSPEDQLGHPTKKYLLPFLPNCLRTSRSADPNRGFCPTSRDRRHCCCAGTRPGRLCLSHSALKKTSPRIVGSIHHDQFNVDPMFELRTALNLSRAGLPVREKLINEHNVMRIAHQNWNSTHLARVEGD
jgi:hypothetical protein